MRFQYEIEEDEGIFDTRKKFRSESYLMSLGHIQDLSILKLYIEFKIVWFVNFVAAREVPSSRPSRKNIQAK